MSETVPRHADVIEPAVRAAVEALLAEAFWYHDHDLIEEQLALYTPGFEVRTPGGTFSGTDAYREFLETRHLDGEFSMHYITNVRVTAVDGDRVSFRYSILNPLRNVAALGGGDLFGVAEGSDIAEWNEGQLRFVEREITVRAVLGRPDATHDQ